MPMEMMIPNEVREVIDVIKQNGYQAYLVGGSVRDTLLNKKPNDYDITTNAKLEILKVIFKDYHQIHNSGEKHSTLTVKINDEIIEVTSFKSTKENPTILDDLACRDITINSIAYDLDLGLIDPFGGVDDIANKIIKANNPYERFSEDYLRILRCLRFASKLGYEIEKTTNQAIFSLKDNLKLMAKERINVELKGILEGPDVFKVLDRYREVIAEAIPEIALMFDFNQNNPYHQYDVYTHTLYVVNNTKPDFVTRMAALLHDVAKPLCYTEEIKDGKVSGHFYGHSEEGKKLSRKILQRLRYPNKEIEEICYLIEYHDYNLLPSKKMIKRILSKTPDHSLELFQKLLDLKQADNLAHKVLKEIDFIAINQIAVEIIDEENCLSVKDLKINGYDLLDLGFEGVIIGDILDALLDMVVGEEISNVKADLIEYVKMNYFK